MPGWLVAKRSARLSSSANAGFGHDPGAREQRRGLGEDAALGDGDDDRLRPWRRGFTCGRCEGATRGRREVAHGGRREQSRRVPDPGALLRGQWTRRSTRGCARAVAEGLTRDSRTGARVLDWPGEPTRDALPLRLFGGLHALVRAGQDAGLAAVFRGEVTRSGDDRRRRSNARWRRMTTALLPWLDGPPQTNEPGRSGGADARADRGRAAAWAEDRAARDRVERGAQPADRPLRASISAGREVGPADAPVTIAPEWKGAAAAPVPIDIVSVRGCDVQPLDATDPAVAARLLAYVWPETPARLARLTRGDRDAARDATSIWSAPTPPTGSRRGWPSRRRRASRAC